ncbi:MAG TPA: UDP-N-acetylmuramate dehydrogenase [Candidatus Saccharimonadales bacterium]|nr:UDP-N-acetylmuramate dehydrogenase [Candidatus Saccharimonadales bacterium]
MNPQQNVSLAEYSTMGLGGAAAYLLEVRDRMVVAEAYAWARSRSLPILMIGGGSNIVWRDEGFPGLVLVNKIGGFETYEEDETSVYLTIGAGENWDQVVERSVTAGLTGIEALSLIPGTAGATPVQNVGAYGQEISETLVSVEAFDTQAGQLINIPAADCAFGYRTSRFKVTDHGRFFITSLTLHLTKGNPMPPFYAAVQAYFDKQSVTDYTPAALREAVVAIRSAKLPDPALVHNTGSFFANPIIDEYNLRRMQEAYTSVPYWETEQPGKVKISAAWLIDQAGLKGIHDQATGMATWPTQPLVLINEHAHSTADLLAFKQKIIDTVQKKFGVTLQQEPELLP